MNHTPGPWQAFTDEGHSVYIWGKGLKPEDREDGDGYVLGPFDGFRKADLDLITSAPELLEALERLHPPCGNEVCPITTLIAKARGES